jgi:hypothetical protein
MPLTPDEFRVLLDKLVIESREEALSDEAMRPSKTWGWSSCFPKRTAAPSLCGGMIAIEFAVDDGGANLQRQMSTSR